MNLINKDTFREIKRSISRFISILLIVGLGVFVFIGLITTGQIMRDTLEREIKSQNYEDILINTTIGFDERDISIIESQEGIKELEYGYDTELLVKDSVLLLKVMNMPYKINMPIITEGKIPESSDEIILDEILRDRGYKIGDKIDFNKEINKFSDNKDEESHLSNYTYKVVGFFDSVQNSMGEIRGQSLRGLGEIKGWAYISASNFNIDPTMVRIAYKDTEGLKTSSAEYITLLDEHKKALDLDFKHIPALRLLELQDDIQGDITEGEDKIKDAKDSLAEGEEELVDAREKLAEGREEYAKGKRDYDKQSGESKEKLQEKKDELYKSEADIKEAEKELADGYKELQDGRKELDDAKKELEDGEREYSDGEREYAEGKGKLETSKTQLEEGEKQLIEGRAELEKGKIELAEAKQKLDEGRQEIAENEKKIVEGQKKIDEGIEEIAAGIGKSGADLNEVEAEVDSLLSQIDQAEELFSNYQLLESKIDEAQSGIAQIEAGQQQVEAGIAQIEAALLDPALPDEQRQALTAQLETLKTQQTELETQLAQAQTGLAQAQTQKASMDAMIAKLPEELNDATKISVYKQKLKEAKAGIKSIRESSQDLIVGQAKIDAAKEQLKQGTEQYEEGMKKSIEGEQKLIENERKLSDGKAEYEKGLQELEDARKKLDDAKQELTDGRAEYEDGEKEYSSGYEDYMKGKEELEVGKGKYELGKEFLEESEKTLNEELGKAEDKLAEASRDLFKGEEDLREGEAEFADKSKDAQEKIAEGEEQLADARRIMRILKQPVYSITPRTLNQGLNDYFDFSKRMDMLSLIFPVFFFLIALLVSFITMKRMVDEQRTIIGTYKALGFTNSEIANKFFTYGALASLIGGIIGVVSGSYILPTVIANAYFTASIFEGNLNFSFFPVRMLLAVLVGIMFTALAAIFSVYEILKDNAANLLRVKAPKGGTRIFLERIKPVWSRLSFLHKVTARNILRYKGRMVMTIIGIMGCMALLVLGFGIKNSINGIELVQFKDIQKYDASISYDREIDKDSYEKYRKDINGRNIEYIKIYQENFNVEYTGKDQNLQLLVPEEEEELRDYFNLRDRRTQEKLNLPDRGVIITEKIARLKDVKEGDSLEIIDIEGDIHKVEVQGIAEMYFGHYIFMGRDYYEKLFGKSFEPNTDLIKLPDLNEEETEETLSEFSGYKSVLSSFDLAIIEDTMNKFMYSISKVEGVIIIASSLLAIIVLYNLTNINIEERIREISTIKVLGFYPKETTAYIYRETLVLTLMGIFIGTFVGKLLHYGVLRAVEPNDMMFNLVLKARSYLTAAFITIGLSFALMIIFHNKLKRINMIEALKSNE
ncbi:permease domain protein [Peptoniphilus sp. ING2-D1G]|nr:permease domain protein [Peptoniphilus sp. ING2-D1G]